MVNLQPPGLKLTRGLERIAASCGTWTLDSEPICGGGLKSHPKIHKQKNPAESQALK